MPLVLSSTVNATECIWVPKIRRKLRGSTRDTLHDKFSTTGCHLLLWNAARRVATVHSSVNTIMAIRGVVGDKRHFRTAERAGFHSWQFHLNVCVARFVAGDQTGGRKLFPSNTRTFGCG